MKTENEPLFPNQCAIPHSLRPSVNSYVDLSNTPYRTMQLMAASLKLPANLKSSVLKQLIEAKLKNNDEVVKRIIDQLEEQKKCRKELPKAPKNENLTPLDLRKIKKPERNKFSWDDHIKQVENYEHYHPSENSQVTGKVYINKVLMNGGYVYPVSQPYSSINNQSSAFDNHPLDKPSPSLTDISFNFSPTLHSLHSPYTDLSFFSSSPYRTEFPFSPREWQSQMSPLLPIPPLPQTHSLYGLPTFDSTFSNFPNPNYGSHFNHTPSTSQDRLMPNAASYPNSYQSSIHLPHESHPSLPSYYNRSTPNCVNSRSCSLSSSAYNLMEPQVIKKSENDPFCNNQSNFLSDVATAASIDGELSFSSSMENNVSWTNLSQEKMNFLNSDLSITSQSSGASNSKSDIEDVELLNLFPELQNYNEQEFSTVRDILTSSKQADTISSVENTLYPPSQNQGMPVPDKDDFVDKPSANLPTSTPAQSNLIPSFCTAQCGTDPTHFHYLPIVNETKTDQKNVCTSFNQPDQEPSQTLHETPHPVKVDADELHCFEPSIEELSSTESTLNKLNPVEPSVALNEPIITEPIASSSSFVEPSLPELFKCPFSACDFVWKSFEQSLDQHLRLNHSADILSLSQTPFLISPTKLREEQREVMVMEAEKILFIITIIPFGSQITVTLQYVPKTDESSGENATILEGALEVIKKNHHPSAWVGRIHSYFTSINYLHISNQCLSIDTTDFGESIRLFLSILFPREPPRPKRAYKRRKPKFETPSKAEKKPKTEKSKKESKKEPKKELKKEPLKEPNKAKKAKLRQ